MMLTLRSIDPISADSIVNVLLEFTLKVEESAGKTQHKLDLEPRNDHLVWYKCAGLLSKYDGILHY